MSQPAPNQVIFITGASAGIGAELARQYAAQGARVALTGRSTERLDEIASEINASGEHALAVQCDVTSRESLDAAVRKTIEEWGRIDTVIANAGFGVSGSIQTLSTEDYRRQFATNLFGLIDTIYATLPHLIESRGRLALISSVMGKLGRANSSAYAASKFAVTGLAESIHYELKPQGVTVTCIHPGLVESNFRMTNNRSQFQQEESDPAPQWLVVPVDVATRAIIGAIQKRKRDATITAHGKALVVFHQYMPWLFHRALGLMKPIEWRSKPD